MNDKRIYLKAITNILIYIFIAIFICFILPKIVSYFLPLVIGWIIMLLANPIVKFLDNKVKIKRNASSVFIIFLVISLILSLLYLLFVSLINSAMYLIELFPGYLKELEEMLNANENKFSFLNSIFQIDLHSVIDELYNDSISFLSSILQKVKDPIISKISSLAMGLPNFFINTIMCILFSYFCIAENSYLNDLLLKVVSKEKIEQVNTFKNNFLRAMFTYFKAQVKIEIWIFFVLSIGFITLDVKNAVVSAFLVSILDFLPILGAGGLLIPLGILDIFVGKLYKGVGFLIIWFVCLVVRQAIQPKIVGNEFGLASIPTVFLIYIGFKSSGLFGMVFAVPAGIILMALYKEGVFDNFVKSIKIIAEGIKKLKNFEE